LRQRLLADPLLNAVPSMQPERGKTARFFHAKDDVPEVRVEVFRLLLAHDLRFSAIVKDKRVLLREAQAALAVDPRAKYKPDGHALDDAMMRKLFKRLGRHGVHSCITFAVRGNKPRTAALKHAVLEVEQHFERDFGFARSVSVDVASGYPWDVAGLQACDYFLWALQRFYERGEERFLNAMWAKVVEVIDMDLEAPKRRGKTRERGVTFTKENPLSLVTRAGLAAASKLGPGDIG
jgi:ribosomal protein S18 acetylase RimI-like enzyme